MLMRHHRKVKGPVFVSTEKIAEENKIRKQSQPSKINAAIWK